MHGGAYRGSEKLIFYSYNYQIFTHWLVFVEQRQSPLIFSTLHANVSTPFISKGINQPQSVRPFDHPPSTLDFLSFIWGFTLLQFKTVIICMAENLE